MTAIDVLSMYADWEAELLNREDCNIIDMLPDDLYEQMINIQRCRNEVVRAEREKQLRFLFAEYDTKIRGLEANDIICDDNG